VVVEEEEEEEDLKMVFSFYTTHCTMSGPKIRRSHTACNVRRFQFGAQSGSSVGVVTFLTYSTASLLFAVVGVVKIFLLKMVGW